MGSNRSCQVFNSFGCLFDSGCWGVCANCYEELFLFFFHWYILWTRWVWPASRGCLLFHGIKITKFQEFLTFCMTLSLFALQIPTHILNALNITRHINIFKYVLHHVPQSIRWHHFISRVTNLKLRYSSRFLSCLIIVTIQMSESTAISYISYCIFYSHIYVFLNCDILDF